MAYNLLKCPNCNAPTKIDFQRQAFFCEYCGAQIVDYRMNETANELRKIEIMKKEAENESRKIELAHEHKMKAIENEIKIEKMRRNEWRNELKIIFYKKLAMLITWIVSLVVLNLGGYGLGKLLLLIDIVICGPIVLIKLVRKWK